MPGLADTDTLHSASNLCRQPPRQIRGEDHASRHDWPPRT